MIPLLLVKSDLVPLSFMVKFLILGTFQTILDALELALLPQLRRCLVMKLREGENFQKLKEMNTV